MKRIKALTLCLFLVVGCGGKVTAIEGLTLVDQAVESSARQTEALVLADQISVKDACKIEVYGSFAHEAVKQGRLQWYTGNPEGAADQLDAARRALTGLTPEVVAVIEEKC